MGQGYIRNDTANNIDNDSVANASDLDGEFDAIVSAFDSTTGHTHDGTSAEGGPITVVGPAQEYVGASGDFSPKTDSTYDLGKTAVRWATAYIDDLDVTTNIVVGGTVDGRDVAADGTKLDGVEALADVTDVTNVTAAGALMDSELTSISSVKALDQGVATTDTPTFAGIVTSGNVDGRDVSVDGTKLDTIEDSADVTDTANVTAAGALMDSEVDADIKTLVLPASTTISTFGASLIDDTDAATALVTLGVSSTAAELDILDGATLSTTELNYVDGVTSSIQTQLDSKAPLASPALTGTPTAPTAAATTDTTQVATTAFVQAALGITNVQVFDASGTYTKTAGVQRIIVIMTGGAGGRGNVEDAGAGSTTVNFLDASAITTSTVTIGAAGATSSVASAGGDTTWSDGTNSLTALGGLLSGSSGSGGVSTTGDINIPAGSNGASIWGESNYSNSNPLKGAWGAVGKTSAGTSSAGGVVIVLEY